MTTDPDAIIQTSERLTADVVAELRARIRAETIHEVADDIERKGFPLLAANLRLTAGIAAIDVDAYWPEPLADRPASQVANSGERSQP